MTWSLASQVALSAGFAGGWAAITSRAKPSVSSLAPS